MCHQSVLASLMLLVEWRSFLPPYLSRGKMPTCETKKKMEKKEEREKDRKGLVVSVLACQSPPGPIRASPHLVGRQIKSELGETGGRVCAFERGCVCTKVVGRLVMNTQRALGSFHTAPDVGRV